MCVNVTKIQIKKVSRGAMCRKDIYDDYFYFCNKY